MLIQKQNILKIGKFQPRKVGTIVFYHNPVSIAMKKILFACIFVSIYFPAIAQENNPLILKTDFQNQKKWVDSIYDAMTLEEKMGQLFMADIFSVAIQRPKQIK